jgi:hypothetical protein
VLAERRADSAALHRPAAERHHRGAARTQHLDSGCLLELPELGFAAALEYLRDRRAGAELDLAVEVEEPPAEALGDLQPECRLARAHEADEGEVAV